MTFSNLPGRVNKLSASETHKCEDCDKPATYKMQGETDSFGAEYFYYCDEHLEKALDDLNKADTSGCCEWCHKHSEKLRPMRDIDEGSNGPVYNVCSACIKRQNDQIDEELDSYQDDGEY